MAVAQYSLRFDRLDIGESVGLRYFRLLLRVVKKKGALSTTKFGDWLNDKLVQKLAQHDPPISPSGPGGKVMFADLPLPLKIIAANVATGSIAVFQQASPEFVSDAVCASISIPSGLRTEAD